MNSVCYIIMVAMLSVCHALSAQSTTQLEKQLKDIMNDYDAVGLSVVVVKDNQPHYAHTFGYRDLEKKEALREDDLFRIASISKSFTTSALLKLVEQGRISLDDNVSDLIGFPVVNPNYPDDVITLEMLLSHTSSLNDSQKYGNLDIINPEKNPYYKKCYSDYAPGTHYRYCNLAHNMAGAILEKLHGKRFDLVIKEEILDPLGMDAGFNLDSLDTTRFAPLYRWNKKSQSYVKSTSAYNNKLPVYQAIANNNYVLGYTGASFSPTGGLKVSASDLAKYMQMHMNYGKYNGKQVVSEAVSKQMQTPRVKVSDLRDYGLALVIGRDLVPSRTLIGHTGSAQGLRSAMFFDPHEKLGFVMVSNGVKPAAPSNGYHPLIKDVIEALYKYFMEE